MTPEPGRGRRQYRDEESLQAAVNQVIEKHRLAGLLEVAWRIEEQREMRFVGRGRGGAKRKQQEVITRRIQITSVKRQKAAIAAHCKRLGWRAPLDQCAAQDFAQPMRQSLSRELARRTKLSPVQVGTRRD